MACGSKCRQVVNGQMNGGEAADDVLFVDGSKGLRAESGTIVGIQAIVVFFTRRLRARKFKVRHAR